MALYCRALLHALPASKLQKDADAANEMVRLSPKSRTKSFGQQGEVLGESSTICIWFVGTHCQSRTGS